MAQVHKLAPPILGLLAAYLFALSSAAGIAWFAVMGSPVMNRFAAMGVWLVMALPFLLAANQWASSIEIDSDGVSRRSPLGRVKTLPWKELTRVRLVVTSHARDDRSVVLRGKGFASAKIAYSNSRKHFKAATRFLLEQAEKNRVDVSSGRLDPLDEWSEYLAS